MRRVRRPRRAISGWGRWRARFCIWTTWPALECVARRRDAYAAFILARAYDTGAGVDEDPARAYDWYVKAHGWGHLEAGLFVANALYLGRGHRRNLTAATRWATAALDAGLPGAAELLGEILAASRR